MTSGGKRRRESSGGNGQSTMSCEVWGAQVEVALHNKRTSGAKAQTTSQPRTDAREQRVGFTQHGVVGYRAHDTRGHLPSIAFTSG
mmetsp:Transcript_6223/g.19817  ORF Transcript_6223/g.19817 Transcript_6223/m.19817 type:complete len:86 (-) Transcript_6223:322-579(-)